MLLIERHKELSACEKLHRTTANQQVSSMVDISVPA